MDARKRESVAGIGRRVEALQLFWAGTEVELAVLGKIAYERQTGSALNSWLKSQLVISGRGTHPDGLRVKSRVPVGLFEC